MRTRAESRPADRERVQRPDGKTWVFDPRSSRAVKVARTPAGVEIAVHRTHDRDLARRMAEVRWGAHHGDVPMPEGELVWRRHVVDSWSRRPTAGFTSEPSSGTESRSYPVVVFAAPVQSVSEKEAS